MPPANPSPRSNDLPARDLAVLWHPCSQMRDYRPPEGFAPLEVVAARGARLKLADGRDLLDAISSWWCKSLGHGHPALRTALTEQAERFEHVILANTTHQPVVRLSERLIALCNAEDGWKPATAQPTTPPPSPSTGPHAPSAQGPAAGSGFPAPHFGKVFYADNGSTAVEIALKMALQAQAQRGRAGRTALASLAGGYHGETLATLSVGDCGLYDQHYRALMLPVTHLQDVPYRSGPDDPQWMDGSEQWPGIQAQLDRLADTLAAIVYEPVLQGAGGMRLYSPDLLVRLRRWADAHEVYLIADEIAAGMGRLGPMLATHLAQNSGENPAQSPHLAMPGLAALPDFAVLSKGLTGGFLPLSAVVTTDAVYDLFDADYTEHKAFLHSNTWTGHALALAVANAALDVYAQEDITNLVARRGPWLVEAMGELARTRPYLHNVRGCGMMAAADLRREDGSPLDPARRTGYRVYREAVRRGALLRPLGDTMYLFPPLNTAPADLQAMLAILADSLDAVL